MPVKGSKGRSISKEAPAKRAMAKPKPRGTIQPLMAILLGKRYLPDREIDSLYCAALGKGKEALEARQNLFEQLEIVSARATVYFLKGSPDSELEDAYSAVREKVFPKIATCINKGAQNIRNIRKYVYAIAKNTIFDIHERKKLRREDLYDLGFDRGFEPNNPASAIRPELERARGRTPSIEGIVATKMELQKFLDEQVMLIPPLQREPYYLFHFGGLSYEEISLHLGLKLGTVKSRISKAREIIRARLGTKQ